MVSGDEVAFRMQIVHCTNQRHHLMAASIVRAILGEVRNNLSAKDSSDHVRVSFQTVGEDRM